MKSSRICCESYIQHDNKNGDYRQWRDMNARGLFREKVNVMMSCISSMTSLDVAFDARFPIDSERSFTGIADVRTYEKV